MSTTHAPEQPLQADASISRVEGEASMDDLAAAALAAAETGERTLVTVRGHTVAIVHAQDGQYLQGLEDELDMKAAAQAREEVRRGETISLEELETDLDREAHVQ